jgi:hypothetical protein
MVINTQNYGIFGLFPTPGMLENRKHDVSETGSVSVLRWGGKTPTQLGPLERSTLHHWTTSVRFTQLFYHLTRDDTIYIVYFLLISLQFSLVSCDYVCVNLTEGGQWWRSAHSKEPKWVAVFPTHLRTETVEVSEVSCFIFSRIPDGGRMWMRFIAVFLGTSRQTNAGIIFRSGHDSFL